MIKSESPTNNSQKNKGRMVSVSAIEINKAKIEKIFEDSPNGLFTINLNKRINSWNKSMEKITGFTREEVIGKNCCFLESDDCIKCFLEDDGVELPIIALEKKINHKNGSLKRISKNVDKLTDSSGNIIGWIESFIDISDKKKAMDSLEDYSLELERMVLEKTRETEFQKEELMAMNQELLAANQELHASNEELEVARTKMEEYSKNLEELVNDRTKELVRSKKAISKMLEDLEMSHKKLENAYKSLESIDELKNDILSNVSHELKTPITIIKSGIEMAMLEDEPQEKRLLLNMSLDSLRRLVNTVDDMVDLSDFKKGALNLKQEEFDLFSIIEEVEKSKCRQCGESIEIVNHASTELGLIKGDRLKIKRVISNLLDNAIKFSGKSNVVEIDGKNNGKFVKLSVKDYGIGIKREDMDKIFSPLTQLDAAATRRYGGVGSGLSICKIVVEAHGGQIWAESQVGKGSTFQIKLPIKGALVK